jgi:hypothetical protein
MNANFNHLVVSNQYKTFNKETVTLEAIGHGEICIRRPSGKLHLTRGDDLYHLSEADAIAERDMIIAAQNKRELAYCEHAPIRARL